MWSKLWRVEECWRMYFLKKLSTVLVRLMTHTPAPEC